MTSATPTGGSGLGWPRALDHVRVVLRKHVVVGGVHENNLAGPIVRVDAGYCLNRHALVRSPPPQLPETVDVTERRFDETSARESTLIGGLLVAGVVNLQYESARMLPGRVDALRRLVEESLDVVLTAFKGDQPSHRSIVAGARSSALPGASYRDKAPTRPDPLQMEVATHPVLGFLRTGMAGRLGAASASVSEVPARDSRPGRRPDFHPAQSPPDPRSGCEPPWTGCCGFRERSCGELDLGKPSAG